VEVHCSPGNVLVLRPDGFARLQAPNIDKLYTRIEPLLRVGISRARLMSRVSVSHRPAIVACVRALTDAGALANQVSVQVKVRTCTLGNLAHDFADLARSPRAGRVRSSSITFVIDTGAIWALDQSEAGQVLLDSIAAQHRQRDHFVRVCSGSQVLEPMLRLEIRNGKRQHVESLASGMISRVPTTASVVAVETSLPWFASPYVLVGQDGPSIQRNLCRLMSIGGCGQVGIGSGYGILESRIDACEQFLSQRYGRIEAHLRDRDPAVSWSERAHNEHLGQRDHQIRTLGPGVYAIATAHGVAVRFGRRRARIHAQLLELITREAACTAAVAANRIVFALPPITSSRMRALQKLLGLLPASIARSLDSQPHSWFGRRVWHSRLSAAPDGR
jgi:hypothetical protein